MDNDIFYVNLNNAPVSNLGGLGSTQQIQLGALNEQDPGIEREENENNVHIHFAFLFNA